jgi:hypothetical protein
MNHLWEEEGGRERIFTTEFSEYFVCERDRDGGSSLIREDDAAQNIFEERN